MDAEYTTAMEDAGVGVGAQRIIMKYFTGFFTFTVPETSTSFRVRAPPQAGWYI
jgi:hypothetical protein